MSADFSLGYSTVRDLRPLAESDSEREALRRLEDFRGTEGDLRAAALMLARMGRNREAAELLDFAAQ